MNLVRLLVVAGLLSASSVLAEEGASSPPAASPKDAPKASVPLVGGNTVYMIAGVAELPFVAMGVALNGGLTLAGGLQAEYNGNGLPTPAGTPGTDKFAANLLVSAFYAVKNVYPVATGPQLIGVLALAPTPASFIALSPEWAVNYAPFNAPIVLSAGIGVRVLIPKGAQPSVATLTSNLAFILVL